MPICRICGCEFKDNNNTGKEICSNDGCWDKAWNDATRPFTKAIQAEKGRKNRRVTSEEKQRIIELHKQGKTRKHISIELDIPYNNVSHIIRRHMARSII